MDKRKLSVTLVCKTENGESIEIGKGTFGYKSTMNGPVVESNGFGTVVRLCGSKDYYYFDLDLSEETRMALSNAIEEAPEDPLGHLLDASGAEVDSMPAQPVTIMASDSATHELTMLVEIHPRLQGEPLVGLLKSFERRMFENKVFTGLFITPNQTRVVRDLVTSKEFENNTFHTDVLNTEKLLENVQVSEDLKARVRTWLNAMSAGSWSYFIPKECYAAMIPFVVGNLAGAVFQDWEPE